MKLLILFGAFFVMPFLFSQSSFAQSVGGSGSGGGGLLRGTFVKAQGGCEEGRVSLISYQDERGKGQVTKRQCVGGSYMNSEEREKYIYQPKIRCQEGRRESRSERNTVQDSMETISVVCTDGKWVEFRRN